MRRTILFMAMAKGIFLSQNINAQVSISINVGAQPIWGPTGYDYVDYYYLPDIGVYYYVPQHQYVYLDGGTWVTASDLPTRYASFDLYNAHKVVINSPNPYLHNEIYRDRYASFKGRHDQHPIRDSHEQKYFEIKEHPEHSKYNARDGNNGDHGHGGHHEEGKKH